MDKYKLFINNIVQSGVICAVDRAVSLDVDSNTVPLPLFTFSTIINGFLKFYLKVIIQCLHIT